MFGGGDPGSHRSNFLLDERKVFLYTYLSRAFYDAVPDIRRHLFDIPLKDCANRLSIFVSKVLTTCCLALIFTRVLHSLKCLHWCAQYGF